LAEDLKHDRKVAVKVLKRELAAILGADRFVQEIKTTASLQHPHILPLFDSGQADLAGKIFAGTRSRSTRPAAHHRSKPYERRH
jgi:serine/threonine protein kinase